MQPYTAFQLILWKYECDLITYMGENPGVPSFRPPNTEIPATGRAIWCSSWVTAQEVHIPVPGSTSTSSFLLIQIPRSRQVMAQIFGSLPICDYLDWSLGFWLWHGPALVAVDIWGRNYMVDLHLPLGLNCMKSLPWPMRNIHTLGGGHYSALSLLKGLFSLTSGYCGFCRCWTCSCLRAFSPCCPPRNVVSSRFGGDSESVQRSPPYRSCP